MIHPCHNHLSHENNIVSKHQFASMAATPYCVWGICESWQVCCGDNQCCDESELDAVFLTAVILGTMTLVALCFVFFYCNSKRIYAIFLKRNINISYTQMENERPKGQAIIQQA